MTLALPADALMGYLLASVRIVSWLVVVPPFSSKAVPNTAKVVLSLGLAFAAAPALKSHIALPATTPALIMETLLQVAIGVSMGLVTFLLFSAIAAAGSLIDVFGGFSLAQGFDPLGLNSSTVFGTFHQMIGMVLLFVTNAHLIVIGGLLSTFRFLPVGASPDLGNGTTVAVTAFRVFFVTAVQIALPMIAVLFLADLGLALLTKVAPQLNAINVMFPAKIGLTLLLVGMSFPVLPEAMEKLTDLATQAMSVMSGAG
ncbi:type III secretion protein [Nocardioides mangrovicus]|uniref:Type III secretion protein n=1 Tax=Nocardioides mangrovicus TaxID=2478913 RepID=A0A3L8P4B7_9ACTN|nr:flagellar biosynthetic protein FliR [Nocardioides mangrovicus]RLV49389.1 type III secretion protein [Nocardioides mangrovicus]